MARPSTSRIPSAAWAISSQLGNTLARAAANLASSASGSKSSALINSDCSDSHPELPPAHPPVHANGLPSAEYGAACFLQRAFPQAPGSIEALQITANYSASKKP